MDKNLIKVKVVFDKVKEMRDEINILFGTLDGRITKLSDVYSEFINSTKTIRTQDVKSFIFSLDSFYFQNSLLNREYKNLKDDNNIIINRMYGEYYKLYKLITEYIEKSHIDNKLKEMLVNRNYPKYDDLNEEKVYEFKLIIQLNEDIIQVVNQLINILNDKEQKLKAFTTNQDYGLNVNNFVSTFNYEVIVLSEHITLYEKYLDFFYHVHEKLFKRLITKISLLEAQLNADIKFEGGLIGKKKDKTLLMKDLNIQGLNKSAAKELRQSIIGNNKNILSSNSSDNNSELSSNDVIPPPPSPSSPISSVSFAENNIIHKRPSLAKQMFKSHSESSSSSDNEYEYELNDKE